MGPSSFFFLDGAIRVAGDIFVVPSQTSRGTAGNTHDFSVFIDNFDTGLDLVATTSRGVFTGTFHTRSGTFVFATASTGIVFQATFRVDALGSRKFVSIAVGTGTADPNTRILAARAVAGKGFGGTGAVGKVGTVAATTETALAAAFAGCHIGEGTRSENGKEEQGGFELHVDDIYFL